MQDYATIDMSTYKDVRKGDFVKKRYIKCPHLDKKCSWRLNSKMRKGYQYLENSCYLSGSFNLECPE